MAPRTKKNKAERRRGATGVERHVAALLGLLILVLATFSNTFELDLALDGAELTRGSPRVQAVTAANLRDILAYDYWWPRNLSGAYRPVTTFSFLVNYAVLGHQDNATGYHAVNLLLHGLNVLLVYILALRLQSSATTAFFMAALFGVHPVTADSVTNVAGRADLLATAAVLSGLLVAIRASASHGWSRRRWLLALTGITTLGVFSKESGLVVVPAVILYDLIFAGDATQPLRARLTQLALRRWIAFVPPILCLIAARYWIFRDAIPTPLTLAENPLFATDAWTARITALGWLGKGMWLWLWPRHLTWDYSVEHLGLFRWRMIEWVDWQVVVAFVAITTLGAVTMAMRRRSPPLLFYVGFCFVALLPTANLLVLIPAPLAERFLYLPSVGACGALVVGSGLLAARASAYARRAQTLRFVLLAVLVVGWSARTYVRNFDWRDTLTVCSHALTVAPDSYRVRSCVAGELYALDARGNIDRVIAESQMAHAILERNTPPTAVVPGWELTQLGTYYQAKGMLVSNRGPRGERVPTAESLEWYAKATNAFEGAIAWRDHLTEQRGESARRVGLDPARLVDVTNAWANLSLAQVHLRAGQPARAVAVLEAAQRLAPRDAAIYLLMSDAEAAQGHLDVAIRNLYQALIVDAGADVLERMRPLYDQLDPGAGAISHDGGQPQLNLKSRLVQAHACAAYERQAVILSAAGESAQVPQLRADAALRYGCPLPSADAPRTATPPAG